jgi:hypothetical protein
LNQKTIDNPIPKINKTSQITEKLKIIFDKGYPIKSPEIKEKMLSVNQLYLTGILLHTIFIFNLLFIF